MLDAHHIKKIFPNSSKEFIERNCENIPRSKISDAKLERDKKKSLVKAISREEKILGGIAVSFTLYRTRPLDPDSAAGSTKDLLDGLRHAHLIPEDNPWQIFLKVSQVKVLHRQDEKVLIELDY